MDAHDHYERHDSTGSVVVPVLTVVVHVLVSPGLVFAVDRLLGRGMG